METRKSSLWIGRILTTLAALPFVLSSAMKFSHGPQIVQGFEHFGWPERLIIPLGVLEALCVLLYLIPQTAALGAIILTGYLGGAIATHTRIGEPVVLHIAIGIFIWLGLFLREPRLAELLPIRGKDFKVEREITINRPREQVFAYLRSLKNFQNWNPFLKPGCQFKMDYLGTDGQPGFVTVWDGDKQVGAGEQEITRVIDGERIDFELRFKKPFLATNQGHFAADSAGGSQTRVRWMMTGKSKFPMTVFGLFFGCKMIEKEFDSGLGKLKAILEK
jgi:uncharacterized protein YndB with AHSA1/START domain